jgi:hypothetical protein
MLVGRPFRPGALALVLLLHAHLAPLHAAGPPALPSPEATAAKVDSAFRKALGPKAVLPAADDETFLRRACLDLTGRLPGPAQARRWAADRAPGKRARLVERLLASDAYAVNWGRYWRDVVTYHTPASANYIRWQLFDSWWAEQVRRNRPFNDIVTALVTATGINDEVAPVNYLTALYGNQVEVAATTSRVFLGVQIQCAECHNAKGPPYWKREQFHGFAAFFGRAKLVQHKDVTGRGTPYAIEGRAKGQYAMTDKRDPGHLIRMRPRFLTGETVSMDATDRERREAFARFLTRPQNPWFARCYVNRIWTALMGWGFYPSVIDLGSGYEPAYPEVLRILEKDFVAGGYDMRRLFRVVTLTEAYRRQLAPPPGRGKAATPAVCPRRLRPEQVFEALVQALEFDEKDKSIPAPAPSSAPALQRHTGLRNMVYQAFKVDPSRPAREVHGTIPQALLMMNSALVHRFTSSRGKTVLARLLAEGRSDNEVVSALYEKVLARRPTESEQAVCRRYLARVGDRSEALEDILWALVNSTEFLTKK